MGYAKEFNFEKYTVPAFLQTINWSDESWHNDMCPRFENKTLGVAVWVAEQEPEEREELDWAQYAVIGLRKDGTLEDEVMFQTEDANKLELWISIYSLIQGTEAAFLEASSRSEPHEELCDELATAIALFKEKLTKLETMQLKV